MAKKTKAPPEAPLPCLIITGAMIEAGVVYYRQAKDNKAVADGAVVMGIFMAMANTLEAGNIAFNIEGQPTTPFKYDAEMLRTASKLIMN